MTPCRTNEVLARVSAETGERVGASGSSVERTNRQLESSRKAVDHSRETLASTVQKTLT